jgi:hypothetical protein
MIIAGIASIPAREQMLEKVIDSLTFQCNVVYVTLNAYDHVPEYFSKYDNVHYEFGDNSKGDAMKFAMADSTDGVYLGCDDDLLYPRGYVQKMIEGVDKYNGLVSLHGRIYPIPVTDFRRWIGNYRCLGMVRSDTPVNLIGSGCCAFRTSRLKVTISDFQTRNMADLWLSKLAIEQEVPIWVLAHKRDYLQYLKPENTIWQNVKDFSVHTKILQSFLK